MDGCDAGRRGGRWQEVGERCGYSSTLEGSGDSETRAVDREVEVGDMAWSAASMKVRCEEGSVYR